MKEDIIFILKHESIKIILHVTHLNRYKSQIFAFALKITINKKNV